MDERRPTYQAGIRVALHDAFSSLQVRDLRGWLQRAKSVAAPLTILICSDVTGKQIILLVLLVAFVPPWSLLLGWSRTRMRRQSERMALRFRLAYLPSAQQR